MHNKEKTHDIIWLITHYPSSSASSSSHSSESSSKNIIILNKDACQSEYTSQSYHHYCHCHCVLFSKLCPTPILNIILLSWFIARYQRCWWSRKRFFGSRVCFMLCSLWWWWWWWRFYRVGVLLRFGCELTLPHRRLLQIWKAIQLY